MRHRPELATDWNRSGVIVALPPVDFKLKRRIPSPITSRFDDHDGNRAPTIVAEAEVYGRRSARLEQLPGSP